MSFFSARSGTLHAPYRSQAPLAVDRAHLPLISASRLDHGVHDFVALLLHGDIVLVLPFERVSIVEDGFDAVRVAVEDGSGRSGWVPSSWFLPEIALAQRGAA